jgi:hypothetical protein
MRSRFSRVMFWVANLACAFGIAGGIMAFSPPQNLPNVLGAWDGFYLAADGATGPFSFDVTLQDFRRLEGNGLLPFLENDGLPYQFNATLARLDFIVGTGETQTGQSFPSTGKKEIVVDFHAGLETYTGLGGEAGVMTPQYHFVPPQGAASRISALLLHPFPGIATPDISGNGLGTFASLADPTIPGDVPDPTFKGIGQLQISPRSARGSFSGRVDFFLEQSQAPVISWPLLATASDDGRLIMVSQGAAGKIIYDGNFVPAPDAESQDFVWGFFRLQFNDGQSFFGAINFNLSRGSIN